jgi:glucose-6-phosphate dehydrogenase assembly protein OpcA
VCGEVDDASVTLLAIWLEQSLRVPVRVEWNQGPGITSVCLQTRSGQVRVDRPDGYSAELSRPGSAQAQVALPRRDLAALLAEELRRLDPDEAYQRVLEGVPHD